jgi:hypothetical protein
VSGLDVSYDFLLSVLGSSAYALTLLVFSSQQCQDPQYLRRYVRVSEEICNITWLTGLGRGASIDTLHYALFFK